MPQQLVIDGFPFSERNERLEGSIALADFSRLAPELESTDGALAFTLQGGQGDRGERLLSLTLQGSVQLSCPRCLRPMDVGLDVDVTYELREGLTDLPTQEELEDDSRDFLPASRSMDVVVLIEDEVLLALPAAPRHSECSLPETSSKPGSSSPFEVLKGIRGGSDKMH
jgi:uncharacterized protein